MKRISEIDKNFKIEEVFNEPDIKMYSCEEEPFQLYGVYRQGDRFRRMPEEVAKSVSEGVLCLHANTAGGQVRFKTDSDVVTISAVMDKVTKMSHFALTGSAGFDLYADGKYVKTFIPPADCEKGYNSKIVIGDCKMRDIAINLPLYSDVKELYIGIREYAKLEKGNAYKNDKPVVYYGSSITQGGCASRPGMSYQSIISRRFNCSHVNLGFSGNAKAEIEMAEYIKGLEMSLFVYDYDHNAPSPEYLKDTHERMFKIVRRANPDLPIIIMSQPNYTPGEDADLRKEIIKKTYYNAVAAGDENVFFVDGRDLMQLCLDDGTVDNCHPTDFGFTSMAKCLGDFMEKNNLC